MRVMSKNIVVITTRYIGEGRLFNDNKVQEEQLLRNEELYSPILKFWGNRLINRFILDPGTISHFNLLEKEKENPYLWRMAMLEMMNEAKSQNDSKDLIRIVRSYSKELSWARKNLEGNKYDVIYKLKSSDDTNEVYALHHLPYDDQTDIFNEPNNRQDEHAKWLNALKETFIGKCKSLFIILHGTTDYGMSSKFSVIGNNNNPKIAIFQHEPDDSVALLLENKKLTAAEFVENIKRLFVESVKKKNELSEAIEKTRGYYKLP